MRECINPLRDITIESPQQNKKKMLQLRTCVERALKKDCLTREGEKTLSEAIKRMKNGCEGG